MLSQPTIIAICLSALAFLLLLLVINYWFHARRSRHARQRDFSRTSVLMNKSDDDSTSRSISNTITTADGESVYRAPSPAVSVEEERVADLEAQHQTPTIWPRPPPPIAAAAPQQMSHPWSRTTNSSYHAVATSNVYPDRPSSPCYTPRFSQIDAHSALFDEYQLLDGAVKGPRTPYVNVVSPLSDALEDESLLAKRDVGREVRSSRVSFCSCEGEVADVVGGRGGADGGDGSVERDGKAGVLSR